MGRYVQYDRYQAATEKGYTPIIHGNSYIQVISWDKAGKLQPTAMLTYSQSPEPESAHYSDLTELYAAGGWIDLPFTDQEIDADPNLRRLKLVGRQDVTAELNAVGH